MTLGECFYEYNKRMKIAMSQYLQHVSGTGDKYQRVVSRDTASSWGASDRCGNLLQLPFADYRICDPPTPLFSDITKSVGIDSAGRLYHYFEGRRIFIHDVDGNYRFLAASRDRDIRVEWNGQSS
jgi:hypothetical protein